jgi:2-polyprenyl-6-hydroxyphenyl methylase / 3-demethylubiquinone-9 3-methyltransferase
MHTVDTKEIENFAKDSAHWWDERGPFKPLHRANHVRLSYIKDRICEHYGRDVKSLKPLTGLSVLDIGCGGGLVCEPMARLGATVTGIDADANAIAVAMAHAEHSGLEIAYKKATTDEVLSVSPPSYPPASGGKAHSARGEKFDIVLALEIVEHVANVDIFVEHCLKLCKPGGIVIFSTLNRTPQSFVFGKFAAEYILGWVPRGTHDWKKFLKPSELAAAVRRADGVSGNIEGMIFDVKTGEFRRSPRNLDINYFLTATP